MTPTVRAVRAVTEALLWASLGSGLLWLALLVDLRLHGEEATALVPVDVGTPASLAVVAVISTAGPSTYAWLRGMPSARLGAGVTAVALLGTSAIWSQVPGAEFLTTPTVVVGAALGALALASTPWQPVARTGPSRRVRVAGTVAAALLLVWPGVAGIVEGWRTGLVAPADPAEPGWAALLPGLVVVLACVAALVHLLRPGAPAGPLVLVVEHEAACPPAHLGRWLEEAGCRLELCRPHAGDALPELAAYDALVVLGGSMGANDDAEVAWLPPLKERLREAAERRLPTLGVCLGHQLVAVALGGTVEPNPRGQQVGLLRVGWRPVAADDPLVGPVVPPRRGIHWNTDVVTALPEGATLLAATPEGDPQVVRFAPAAWGVQLHPEADVDVVRSWADGDREDHLERGIDQEDVLRRIKEAADELEDHWRPVALSFARLAGAGR